MAGGARLGDRKREQAETLHGACAAVRNFNDKTDGRAPQGAANYRNRVAACVGVMWQHSHCGRVLAPQTNAPCWPVAHTQSKRVRDEPNHVKLCECLRNKGKIATLAKNP